MVNKCKLCKGDGIIIELGIDKMFICKDCVEYLSFLHFENTFDLLPEVAASIFNAHCSLILLRKTLPQLIQHHQFSELTSELTGAVSALGRILDSSENEIHESIMEHLYEQKNQLETLLNLYDLPVSN
ncbi:hypothetical protein J4H15_04925 [Vibrio alginolyticus]|uniref:hypothetical protein n=1 Tax=Vibrio alginolyticus TaxID=663 RepID=UPI001BD4B0C6|nr:hypothetical protein [Vibrio alginolyticus]MBS9950417.1 hypothetical protein [Vibrio alginolyticus]